MKEESSLSFEALTAEKMEVGDSHRYRNGRNRGRSSKLPSKIHSLDHDILCTVFSFLDFVDLVHCSVVCKSWNGIINKSKLLKALYLKEKGVSESLDCSDQDLSVYLEGMALERHGFALREGSVDVRQWRGHSFRVNKCRMNMGKLVTGVGDKVIRVWSLDNHKCIEEYPAPDTTSLVDFDFDESKIVGLLSTRICIWRRNESRNIFPSREGTFPKGLCMRYFDPEAVVGCEDGTVRLFDMYSRKCSRIIRMGTGPTTCLCLTDDQLIITGSSLGTVSISGLLYDQNVTKLRSRDSTDLQALSFNPCSRLIFAGSTSGQTTCWDIRTGRILWEKRASPNVIYSLQHMRNDTSILAVGGIDGVLRFLNQNDGQIISSLVSDSSNVSSYSGKYGDFERMKGLRLSEDANIDNIDRNSRPRITCLAVGMKKVVTTNNSGLIRLWKFGQ